MDCHKCNDTGTINEQELVDGDTLLPNGEYMKVWRVKIDPMTGNPPLCECQKSKIFEKYNASAGLKPNEKAHTFDTAEIDNENRDFFLQCRRFIENIEFHLQNGSWLYICGDDERAKKLGKSAFGTGKSYVTHCMANLLTDMRQRAIYITEDKLFEEIKDTYNRDSDETEKQVMFRYENVPILLIDDLFKSKTTDWTEDKLFHLLNNRLQTGKVTIINSNYAPNRIEVTMPKNGKAIASRILGQAVLIEMIGKDRRRDRALQRYKSREDAMKWTT